MCVASELIISHPAVSLGQLLLPISTPQEPLSEVLLALLTN